jgi:SAM-dependent methyltransferase
MRLGALPDNPVEWILLRAGALPTPLLDTHIAMLLARAVMEATRLGVFEALAGGPLGAAEVAVCCRTHPDGTARLMGALAGAGYLRFASDRYALAPVSRKWLLAESPRSLRDKLLLQFDEWAALDHIETLVRTGRGLDMHTRLTPEQWGRYQRGMRAVSSATAAEAARRTPVPRHATHMLDIGGAHGFYSVALCRRHPRLRSVILDLPAAVAEAAPILARENMGDRVVHRAGDALQDDLGEARWDLVFVSQLVHHFDERTNLDLARRAARALRPGGVLVIQEICRPESPARAGQVGALLDLYFAVTSTAGTWTFAEIAAWQQAAGLTPRRPIRFVSAPGMGQQVAAKPARG